jgi:hypothetical protein
MYGPLPGTMITAARRVPAGSFLGKPAERVPDRLFATAATRPNRALALKRVQAMPDTFPTSWSVGSRLVVGRRDYPS